ncbi:MAG: glycogen debranching protein [Lachnospiraceae bacterium]|nr:glycogen debranching protein [Lachnospiraceae bacterium]
MKFDLEKIPFSMPDSFMALSEENNRIFIRSVRGHIATPLIAGLEFRQRGKKCRYFYEADPVELLIRAEETKIRICFADSDTLLIESESVENNIECELFMNFDVAESFFDYIYEIPKEDGIHYMVNAAKNNCKYIISVQTGSAVVHQEWDERKSNHAGISFHPYHGKLSFSFSEVKTEWDEKIRHYCYQESLELRQREFTEFYRSMPETPEKYEETRRMAAYINWSAFVRADGFLTRRTMYMSKNQMCSVWSWDHCFNAMALAYYRPREAWEQFILMFDQQDMYGRIPDCLNDSEIIWNFCKPPIHGWALSKMMQHMTLSRQQKKEALDKLSKLTSWWFRYRDHDHDNICEYCHGNDSGWDNSTAFCALPPAELPDLQAFLILQLEVMEGLASDLGKELEAKTHHQKKEAVMQAMQKHCFLDNLPVAVSSGTHKLIKNESLLLYETIILGKRLPTEICEKMIQVLKGEKFLTDYGYATESPSSINYQSDGYWRGPIWAPSTMILLDGLQQCGEDELSVQVAEKFCDMIQKNGFAENFDALTGEGLRDRAYTWTASVFLVLANEFLLDRSQTIPSK